jgi:hypothetical protein
MFRVGSDVAWIFGLPTRWCKSIKPATGCSSHRLIDSTALLSIRWVFHVHLEKAVLIAVAGDNGRISIQDFWHHGGKDTLQLESYAHDVLANS